MLTDNSLKEIFNELIILVNSSLSFLASLFKIHDISKGPLCILKSIRIT